MTSVYLFSQEMKNKWPQPDCHPHVKLGFTENSTMFVEYLQMQKEKLAYLTTANDNITHVACFVIGVTRQSYWENNKWAFFFSEQKITNEDQRFKPAYISCFQ